MSEVIDNTAHRIRTLKQIITRLHEGQAPDQVRSQLRQLVGETDSCEIMAMEQQLIAEGMPVERIQAMCDLHSQVTRDVLVSIAKPVPPGHPVDTFRRENEALRKAIEAARNAMSRIGSDNTALLTWRQAVNDLMDVDKHYQRKENTVFSCLERHGVSGPSKVMWAKDDEARSLLKELNSALRRPGIQAAEAMRIANGIGELALRAVEEMIYKEEKILLPMCLQTFTEEEWGEIWSASPRYGWCLVDPREGYRPPTPEPKPARELPAREAVLLPTGYLSLEQLTAIFSTLPVDLTFVDADDRVAFFSEGPDRIFSRSKAILGRQVQNCHPPKSVEIVDRILSDFREGRQNVAEFWIELEGRFVHIRYFAVRDAEARYLGTLEVTQDVTAIRGLQDERRLLQY